jgi:hypothetical protein
MGEVKKSASQRVYKSASGRNLPVPAQSVFQLLSIMDSEGDPFETPLEKEYNRILGEMAQQKEDCENKIEELQQKLSGHVKGAGDTSGGKVIPVRGPGDLVGNVTHDTSSGHEGGSSKNVTVVKRPVDVHSGTGSGSHNSSFGHSSNSSIPSSGTGNHTVFHSDGFNNDSTPGPHNDTVPTGGGCVPCPDLREACGPTAPSHGDSCASPMVLATPEAILVGAAAAVLVLVVAAAVAIIVHCPPKYYIWVADYCSYCPGLVLFQHVSGSCQEIGYPDPGGLEESGHLYRGQGPAAPPSRGKE